jgi:hypothetical protein
MFDNSSPPINPYDAPEPLEMQAPGATRMPTLCLVVAIVDLVFCSFRVLFVGAGLTAVLKIGGRVPPQFEGTAWFEVVTGIGIIAFGFPAAIGMLSKRSWATPLAYMAAVATLGSLFVAVWQGLLQFGEYPPGSTEAFGFIIGIVFSVGIRLGILALYLVGVLAFRNWIQRRFKSSHEPAATRAF